VKITREYKKRVTPSYYKKTKCSMKEVEDAGTKTGRKCVGKGQSTKNQIAARRAYDKVFIPWYRKGANGNNPAQKAAAYYAKVAAKKKAAANKKKKAEANAAAKKTSVRRSSRTKRKGAKGDNAKKTPAVRRSPRTRR
jgi:hypothetical protein